MATFFRNIIDFLKFRKGKASYTSIYPPRGFSHFYYPDNSFKDDFYSNLIKTINWTEQIIVEIDEMHINYTTALRKTNPEYEDMPFYRYERNPDGFAATPDIPFNYLKVFEFAMKLRTDKTVPIKNIPDLGQILEFDIDITTHDGVQYYESDGFIDESDIPPIDTWFYLTQTKLYCWIPDMFIIKMQPAIDVDIFDSYRWFKDSDPSMYIEIMNRLFSIKINHTHD